MKRHKNNSRLARRLLAGWLLVVGLCSVTAVAQDETAKATSPDAPSTQSSQPVGTTTRFIGYMTNPSFFFPDIAFNRGSLTTGQKFKLFVNQSISPPYIFAAAVTAAYGQAENTPGEYGQGWNGYASRFGAAFARASSNSFFSSFVLAAALRQDPRFFPQSHPSFGSSIKYAARRVFVTRTDSGGETFNIAGIGGSVAAEALANVYLPPSQQTAAKNCERVGTDLAWQFGAYVFKNYWPTVFHHLGLNHLKVIPDPGSGQQPDK
jgi:hypothetical protein